MVLASRVSWFFALLFLIVKLVFGVLLVTKPPKRNALYGFRTKTSLSNDALWHYANTLTGKLFLAIGFIELVLYGCFFLFFYQGFSTPLELRMSLLAFIVSGASFNVITLVVHTKLKKQNR